MRLAVLLLSGCALDVVFPAHDTGAPEPPRVATTPVAPTAEAPMWQGLQEAFLDADGAPCAGLVAAAMSRDAFCFVASGGELRCAGRVHTTDFGATFTGAGVTGVRQVQLSPTTTDTEGNAACALADGVLACLGGFNASGQLANGTTEPNAAFAPWGDLTGVVGAATGTWDQLCVLDDSGEARCAGRGHGADPVAVGTGGAVIVDTSAALSLDDPARWRASAGRAVCFVTAAGLACEGPFGELGGPGVVGEAGHVVDGFMPGPEPVEACWLDDQGRAWCGDPSGGEPVFAERPVLLLAGNAYTDALCAIHADGSVACRGTNDRGKLGTGTTADLVDEAIVAPAGTVDTRCR